jgi:D-arabinose 1-dehydrogenase-like Zn-dependent alcohol dehydrogenase
VHPSRFTTWIRNADPDTPGASSISGSNIGSPNELKAMMQFAVEHNIKPWVERWDMNDINRAMPAFKEGKPRYRYVLVNTENGGRM